MKALGTGVFTIKNALKVPKCKESILERFYDGLTNVLKAFDGFILKRFQDYVKTVFLMTELLILWKIKLFKIVSGKSYESVQTLCFQDACFFGTTYFLRTELLILRKIELFKSFPESILKALVPSALKVLDGVIIKEHIFLFKLLLYSGYYLLLFWVSIQFFNPLLLLLLLLHDNKL